MPTNWSRITRSIGDSPDLTWTQIRGLPNPRPPCAEHGLLVSWGGFKQTIEKERAAQFFRVRLWNRDDLITNLLGAYDRLDEEIRNKLPLKRIWCVSAEEGE